MGNPKKQEEAKKSNKAGELTVYLIWKKRNKT